MDIRAVVYPLLVLAGGCCYGILSTIVKLAYEQGYTFADVVVSQYFSGWVILGIFLLILLTLRRNRTLTPSHLRTPLLHRVVILLITGAVTCSVCLFYYLSLETTPASVAVVLLFQFTWIGIILESIAERRLPSRTSVIAVAILLIGTLFAGGVLGTEISLTPIGVCAGLLCAFCYAVFIFLSGRIEPQMHPVHRSFWIVTCALFVLLCVLSPEYFTSGTVISGIWIYGAALGLFGACLPVLLYAVGTPKISTGAATILSSSELPVAIITSVIVLHEAVSWIQWFGVLCIFAGIAYPHLRSVGKEKKKKIPKKNLRVK
ncbi:EamA family transporter [Methanocorpusculum sp. MG]|uniref:EamA family transporter n=1 Tax=Methanocorpusculum petauri TaxID=3002863 RepID=A0ABT4IGW7_9EURY|nr:EamA family transporter [Methanocorpusculum petauri]MCZ0860487.1 EamA family transporter [Methanocorpusculum petauri]MDE2444409.1 EamA family transporter [Methanocorpusculum sp.]